MSESSARLLNPGVEADRLEIASQLYERFCTDLMQQSDKARVRLVSGIQVAIRDAWDGGYVMAPLVKNSMNDPSAVIA